ncbi:hypothetical protein [Vandammella animalimorsus]|uniref:Uncharacterized protein n=1 Tax=Vandammella animalimorsus TaxID=2029117 RepID=A0A2A2AC27_9BURK|nr:hypothetical protein [Vandammella animalimorsus]PAT35366.1 hypothetical protein CK620_05695 [Vandammella animalimorsus]
MAPPIPIPRKLLRWFLRKRGRRRWRLPTDCNRWRGDAVFRHRHGPIHFCFGFDFTPSPNPQGETL